MEQLKIQMLNVSQAAEYVGICRMTLTRRRRQGLFPEPIQMGGRAGWTKEYIDEYYRLLQEKAIKQLAA